MTLAIVNEINIVMLFVILKMWFEINNITAQAQVIESIGFTNNNVTLKWVFVLSRFGLLRKRYAHHNDDSAAAGYDHTPAQAR